MRPTRKSNFQAKLEVQWEESLGESLLYTAVGIQPEARLERNTFPKRVREPSHPPREMCLESYCDHLAFPYPNPGSEHKSPGSMHEHMHTHTTNAGNCRREKSTLKYCLYLGTLFRYTKPQLPPLQTEQFAEPW